MDIICMKKWYNEIFFYMKERQKMRHELDADDTADMHRYMRYCKQISNCKQELRVWKFLIDHEILVHKPGNRRVQIKHPVSGTIINYMPLSFKAQIKGHGWVKMGLKTLKAWYFNNKDKYKL